MNQLTQHSVTHEEAIEFKRFVEVHTFHAAVVNEDFKPFLLFDSQNMRVLTDLCSRALKIKKQST